MKDQPYFTIKNSCTDKNLHKPTQTYITNEYHFYKPPVQRIYVNKKSKNHIL